MIIIIFDFDDTLFATSYFSGKEKNSEECYKLELSINKIINIALQYGKVYIITNAKKSWIKKCISDHIPNCETLLNTIETISTVDDGFSKDIDNSFWKYITFMKILQKHFDDKKYHHLISFGDNIFDRFASIGILNEYKNVTVKNFLMVDTPKLTDILWQQDLLSKNFHRLVCYEENLDIFMKDIKV